MTTLSSSPLRLSYSSLSTYLRCARSWAFRYVERIKTPASGAMVQGRAFHTVIETSYRAKMERGELLSVDASRDLFAAEFDAALAKEPVELRENETSAGLIDEGVKLVHVHREKLAPLARPHALEVPFEVDLWGDGLTFSGYVDMVEEDGTIVDHKTWSAARVPTPTSLANDMQLSAYAVASEATTGRPVPGLRLDGIKKLRAPQAIRLPTSRTPAQLGAFVDEVAQVARGIRAESFPYNPGGWWCSPAYCSFWSLCPMGGKR